MHQDTVTQARQQLLRYPNVKSVGIGYLNTNGGQPIVALRVQLKDGTLFDSVPAIINSIPVDIVD